MPRDPWEVVGGQVVNCLRTWAREFRYDSGRARYLMRDLDLATLQPPASYAGLWTDYAQDTAYGDYTLSPGASGPEATTLARYQPGAWERLGDALRVHHGDQIGSSRVMTNASAQTARRAVFYTAFGELVLADDGHGGPPAASRYGYAGAWGYETGLDDGGEPDLPPLPFLHVGERWYDPATGRFLQRDPIGIAGGLNVFRYVKGQPVANTDPTGMRTWLSDLGTALDDAGVYLTSIVTVWAVVVEDPISTTAVLNGAAAAGILCASGRAIQRFDQAIEPITDWYKRPVPPPPVTIPQSNTSPVEDAYWDWRTAPPDQWGSPYMDSRWWVFHDRWR